MTEGGPARRTRLNAAQRRESILQAAIEVFTRTGYRAGRVCDVATRVGVSEPVVFQNFGSKADLFAAVLDRVASEIRADLQELIVHHGSAAGVLAHVLSPSPARVPHGPGSHGVLFADAVTLAAGPELSEPAGRAAAVLAAHLADLLRRGQADGDIRRDLDPEPAAWLLLSVLSARPLRAAAMPDPDRLESGVTTLVFQALTPPPPAPATAARPHHG